MTKSLPGLLLDLTTDLPDLSNVVWCGSTYFSQVIRYWDDIFSPRRGDNLRKNKDLDLMKVLKAYLFMRVCRANFFRIYWQYIWARYTVGKLK